MPGYIIHLAEASIFLEQLKKRNLFDIDKDWERTFLYGCLLPDSLNKDGKVVSHFWSDKDKGDYIRTPDLEAFINQYMINLKNPGMHPLLCGYFVHLHLDHAFFDDFMRSLLKCYDSEGNRTDVAKNINYVVIAGSSRKIPVLEFFSEDYLYGDYTKLNRELIMEYQLELPEYNSAQSNKEEINEIKDGDMKVVLQKMHQYVEQSKQKDGNLKVFCKQELFQFLEATAKEAVDLLCEYVIK